jgi:hypothetical protein
MQYLFNIGLYNEKMMGDIRMERIVCMHSKQGDIDFCIDTRVPISEQVRL